MVLRILERYTQKIKLNQPLTIYKRINSKCIKDLNVRLETVKTQEENLGSKISDIAHSNIFFWYISSNKGNKRKNKQMGLHQTKKFLQRKANHQQNEKTMH